jgi:hypothetical protein
VHEKEKLKTKAELLEAAEFFPEVDPYLDLDYAAAMNAIQVGTDCLVPVQNHVGGPNEPSTVHAQSQLTSSDSELPHKDGYNHCTSSLSYTVSSHFLLACPGSLQVEV